MDNVINQIGLAFEGVKCPPQDRLLYFPESDDLWIETFIGHDYKSWEEIPNESIEYENSALPSFSPDAFVFFLPAYITWVVKNYKRSNSTTVDHTISALNLSKAESIRQIQLEQFKQLTVEQSSAVLAFLKYIAKQQLDDLEEEVEVFTAASAIDNYWGQFGK